MKRTKRKLLAVCLASLAFVLAFALPCAAFADEVDASANEATAVETPAGTAVENAELQAFVNGLSLQGDTFIDVNTWDWFYNCVIWADYKGLMKGHQGSQGRYFFPDYSITRAELCQVLYNLQCIMPADEQHRGGVPDTSSYKASELAKYYDINPNEWYSECLAWCSHEGIITGYTDPQTGLPTGVFAPEALVTREQTATILYRFASGKNWNIDQHIDDIYAHFADAGNISKWAFTGMNWATGTIIPPDTPAPLITGIPNPPGKPLINPQGGAQRCEVAMIFYRFYYWIFGTY